MNHSTYIYGDRQPKVYRLTPGVHLTPLYEPLVPLGPRLALLYAGSVYLTGPWLSVQWFKARCWWARRRR